MRNLIKISLLLIFFAPLKESHGSFSNPNNILIGGEAQGRGGAATALITDASSMAYYNPAAGAHTGYDELSAGFTVYAKFDTAFSKDRSLLDSATRVNRGFWRSLPTATGSVFKRDKWSFGFSILLVDFNTFDGNIAGTPDTITNLRVTDESIWSGGHISWKISKTESIGLSLHYTARNHSHGLFDQRFLSGSEAVIYAEEKNYYYNSLVYQLGYLVRWSEKWALGFSYRPPALKLSGRGSYQRTTTQTNPFEQTLVEDTQVRSKGATPELLRLGFYWKPVESTSYTADIHWSQYLSYQDLESELGGDQITYHPTVNFSLGMETRLLDNLKWRLGLFTNQSHHRNAPEAPTRRVADVVDQWGISGNVALKTKENVEFTIGGYYTGGDGESWQRTAEGLSLYPKSQQIFSLMVGTSYIF